MKRIIKTLLKIISTLFLIGIIIITYTVYQLETSIDLVLSNEQKEWLYNDIRNTEELPENYIKTLEKYYPDFLRNTFWESLVTSGLKQKRISCECDKIYLPYFPGNRLNKSNKYPFNLGINLNRKVITLDLDKRFSQRKCFEYNMHISEFGLQTNGIKAAAKKYFNKELKELNEKEVLILNTIHRAPFRYSRPHGLKEIEQKAEQLIKKHHL